MAAEHRSIVPTLPGVPSWGAVLIAVTFAAVGFAFDAGSGGKELTAVFAGAYVVGCIAAVLVVRQSGVFTAVIQPPLILFVTVPGAYFLFHGATIVRRQGPADQLRLSLDRALSVDVLHLGGRAVDRDGPLVPRHVEPSSAPVEAAESEGRFSAVTSKISGLLTRASEDKEADEAPAPRHSRQHSIDRATKAGKKAAGTARTRSGRPVKRAQPSRSRHTRPPETEIIEPVSERPRRPRAARRATDPTVPPAEPRRRPRTSSAREPRKQPPPSDRRSPYQRPDRHSRFDGFEPFEPHGTDGSNGLGSLNGTHHPISRVRYRGADDGDQRPEYRSRPRASRHQAETSEYDV